MINHLEDGLVRIERVLGEILPDSVDGRWLSRTAASGCPEADTAEADVFLEPGRALMRRGGKRWRPLVTVLTCEALGGERRADLLAALTEIPHNGSLIVDDIEDSSLTRRGAPAIHLEFGVDLAVNMGNLMYFLPSVVFERGDFDGETTAALVQDWLGVMRRLHLGQGYDILWHGRADLYPDRGAYLRMCRFKTGSLASLAARLGARAALAHPGGDAAGVAKDVKGAEAEGAEGGSHSQGAAGELIEGLGAAWEDLGTGFQILDDVQNLSSGIPGKDRGDDIVEGKKSLPVILHAGEHPGDRGRLAALFARAAEGAPEGDWSAVNETIALLEESGAIRRARDEGRALLDSGRSRIIALLPDTPPRGLLVSLLDGFRRKMI